MRTSDIFPITNDVSFGVYSLEVSLLGLVPIQK